jgi:hypothetical protein
MATISTKNGLKILSKYFNQEKFINKTSYSGYENQINDIKEVFRNILGENAEVEIKTYYYFQYGNCIIGTVTRRDIPNFLQILIFSTLGPFSIIRNYEYQDETYNEIINIDTNIYSDLLMRHYSNIIRIITENDYLILNEDILNEKIPGLLDNYGENRTIFSLFFYQFEISPYDFPIEGD